jgi:hypothetical protein
VLAVPSDLFQILSRSLLRKRERNRGLSTEQDDLDRAVLLHAGGDEIAGKNNSGQRKPDRRGQAFRRHRR